MGKIKIIIMSVLCMGTIVTFAQNKTISGYTYIDSNNNGIFDKNEKPLMNVSVSNGVDIVQTDKSGKYTLPLFENASIFVIKPSGYISRLSESNIPQFYAFNKPQGSPAYIKNGIAPSQLPEILNFAFYPNKNENNLKVGLLGDPQPKCKDDVFYIGKLVAEQLIDEHFDLVIPLGDIVHNDLSLLEPVKQTLGKIGCVIYPVMGNHDQNYEAENLSFRDEAFKRVFGPSYYAFNYGENSFLVINNIFPDTTTGSTNYIARIDDAQMKFIENYLATLSPETPIFMFMHIPVEQLENKKEFLMLFKDYPNVTAYAGHTHSQYYLDIEKKDGWPHETPLTELVAGAICGSHWQGEKDVFGVPYSLMKDGTPKGYWVMNITNKVKPAPVFKLSGNIPDRQMHIWVPFNYVFEKFSPDDKVIYANIYAGNNNTKVDVQIEGQDKWIPMEKVLEYDSYYNRIMELSKMGIPINKNIHDYKIKEYPSRHLWKAAIPENLPKGIYIVNIKATDPFGLNAKSMALLYVE
ncbi:calcineurin-like phosphoesterase C-terminal domain-containing protein [Mariniphaga anaerophila]|nr:calcineurin-like phosphoesterase family protein [Mariniphaga anaerophila]